MNTSPDLAQLKNAKESGLRNARLIRSSNARQYVVELALRTCHLYRTRNFRQVLFARRELLRKIQLNLARPWQLISRRNAYANICAAILRCPRERLRRYSNRTASMLVTHRTDDCWQTQQSPASPSALKKSGSSRPIERAIPIEVLAE